MKTKPTKHKEENTFKVTLDFRLYLNSRSPISVGNTCFH